jgi:hypothetical protein
MNEATKIIGPSESSESCLALNRSVIVDGLLL